MYKPPPEGFYIGDFPVAYYGIIVGIAILAAVLILYFFAKYRDIKKNDVIDMALITVPFGILGARLMYVITAPESYTFMEFFGIGSGGMAGLSIYGAIIGGAIGLFIACLWKKYSFAQMGDITVCGIILAHGIGRWGNFFNQELYGRVVENGFFPFAVFIERTGQMHLALFFIEFLANLAGFFVLWLLLKKFKDRGIVLASYFIWYGVTRAILEPLRLTEFQMVIFGVIPFSFMVSIIWIILGLAMISYILIKKGKKENV